MLWRLVGGGGKFSIAQTALAAFQPDDFLAIFQNFHLFEARFFVTGDGTKGHINVHVLAGTTGTVVAAAGFPVIGMYELVIAEVKQGPGVFVAPQDDMRAAAAITPVGAGQRIVFGAHKMFDTGAAMAAPAKNPDLIYKIAFFHWMKFGRQR